LQFLQVESNVRSYSRAYPRVFDRAIGAEIWDNNGARYLDFLAGCGALNYGHNNPFLKESLIEYISRNGIALGLDLTTIAKDQFLEALNEYVFKPNQLDYVVQFTGPTGTNAIEAAFKLARKVTGRTNIVSFTNGFHGVSMGALAATGNEYHDTPAAVVVETVQGEGGLNSASATWLKQLQMICKKWDILLIIDDIQAGCGRTGTFLSFEKYNLKPDIVTLSKSISGYGLPMSVVLLRNGRCRIKSILANPRAQSRDRSQSSFVNPMVRSKTISIL